MKGLEDAVPLARNTAAMIREWDRWAFTHQGSEPDTREAWEAGFRAALSIHKQEES